MVGALSLIAGLILLAVPATLLPPTLRVRGGLARAVAGMLVAAAEIVLLTEVLSLVDAWRAGWMLSVEILAAAAAGAIWWVRGRVPLGIAVPGFARVRGAARRNPLAATAVGLALVALAVQSVLAVAALPNNSDSMTYHLARIAYWLQFDSVLHFDLGTARQLAAAPNAEYIQGWTLLLGDSVRLPALVQWAAAFGLGASVALGSRVLGFGRPAAAFAGAVFVLLPQPLLQATTTQNDLTGAFFMLAAVVFAVRAIRDRHLGEITIASVAMALAIGTKGTTLIAGFSILLLIAAALAAYRPPPRFIGRATAIAVAGFVLFGAFNYVLNYNTYSDPLGPITESTGRSGGSTFDNGIRVIWSYADSPGVSIPVLSDALERTGEALFSGVKINSFQSFGLDSRIQEDFSSYGLFGLLIFLPLLVIVLARPRSPTAWRLLAAASLLYILVFILSSGSNPFVGRVLMPAMALGAPLIALLYRRPAIATIALVLVVLNAVPVVLANQSKPLLTDPDIGNVFSLDDRLLQTTNRPAMREPLAALDAELEPDTPIGLVRGGGSWEFLFFGPDLERRVVPLTPGEASQETIAELGLGAIVFADVSPPAGVDAEPIGDGYWLLR